MAGTLLVVGARNLGAAVAEHFAAAGWNVGAVARSEDTIERLALRVPGLLGHVADASDPDVLMAAAQATAGEFGSLDLMVNAASPGARSRGTFGGGPLSEATPEDFEHYALQVARMVFSFLSVGSRALRANGSGTLIQVTGGSSRRAIPGRGPWAAGAFATRGLTQSAALELREEGIHAALLIVDAVIESPRTAELTRDMAADAVATGESVARAVAMLASQPPNAWTHELQITPRGDRWVP